MLYNVPMPDAPRYIPVPAGGIANALEKAPQTIAAYLAGKEIDNKAAVNGAISKAMSANEQDWNKRTGDSARMTIADFNAFGASPPPVAPTGQMMNGLDQASNATSLQEMQDSVHAAFANDPPEIQNAAKIYEAGAGLNFAAFKAREALVEKGYTEEQAQHKLAQPTQEHYTDIGHRLISEGIVPADALPHQYNPYVVSAAVNEQLAIIARHDPEKALALRKEFMSEGEKKALGDYMQSPAFRAMPPEERQKELVNLMLAGGNVKDALGSMHAMAQETNAAKKLAFDEKKLAQQDDQFNQSLGLKNHWADVLQQVKEGQLTVQQALLKVQEGQLKINQQNADTNKIKAEKSGGISPGKQAEMDKKDAEIDAAREYVKGKSEAELMFGTGAKMKALSLKPKYSESGAGQGTAPSTTPGGARKPLGSIFTIP